MKNTLHGYMTVEAALLMPTVWFSIFFLIFAGFFQYDRCIAEQDGKVAVMRASEMREQDEAEVIRKVIGNGELAGKKKLIFSSGVQKELRMPENRAVFRISGKVNTILNSLAGKSGFKVFSYAAKYEAEKYEPVQFIRVCRRIEQYAGD